ncbi:hypothetical protein MBOVa_3220 [Mycoplasmopsis bovis 8790]|nr:hypothetical protein MBOVa_3220 [Mycoplasmopsis bovis 8790]
MHFLKCNKQNIFNMLRSIEYPAIVVDTEFFNKGHHNKCKLPVRIYSKNQKNIVYALSYLIVENKNSFNVKLNDIKELFITKKLNDDDFNFNSEYSKLKSKFIRICLENEIKTIIFAGHYVDKSIVEKWANQNKKMIESYNIDSLFKYDYDKNAFIVNYVDTYDILKEINVSSSPYSYFSLYLNNNKNDIFQIRRISDLFELHPEAFSNKIDYKNYNSFELSCDALKFYAMPANLNVYNKLLQKVRNARKKCKNDVLEASLFMDFILNFVVSNNWMNPNYMKYNKAFYKTLI